MQGIRGTGGVRRVGGALLLSLGLVVGLSGCDQAGSPASGPGLNGARAQQGAARAETVNISTSVADGAKDVKPDTKVTATVEGGTLSSVALTPKDGKAAPGEVDGDTWSAAGFLLPDKAYKLTVIANDGDGNPVTQQVSFSTLKPRVTATYRVLPDKETVGVGMPATVTFDSPVATPEQRAAVQKQVSITVTPEQPGSWGWSTNSQLMWRPQTFWKPGTKVSVSAPLAGMQTGDGKWVGRDASASFTVGRSRISTVDLKNHKMTVKQDGKVVDTYPISGGMKTSEYETRSGTKVITEKHSLYTMDAASLGVAEDDPAYYKLDVRYAMRVTNTGEFLHSAPWSVWAQGKRNVSHGCVNMGPQDAREMFQQSLVGDVVDFVGSGRKMVPGEGMDVWLYSWKAWQRRSAVTAGT